MKALLHFVTALGLTLGFGPGFTAEPSPMGAHASPGVTPPVSASDPCSDWVKVHRLICVFAGEDASLWKRTCTDPDRICKNRRYQHEICDAEDICVDSKINPNLLTTVCTEWIRHEGVRCQNKKTGRTERRWVRACQLGGVTTAVCSDRYPEAP